MAIEAVYPKTKTLLCLWHVLHAIRSHFVTEKFLVLWSKVKALVNTKDLAEFFNLHDYIFTDPSVPSSVVQYMTKWMQVPHMWSKMVRKKRSIYHEGDTNMLLEGYHHLYKMHFLDGKCNRWINHALYALVKDMVLHYEDRHARQSVGLEGPDLLGQQQHEI
ncbi:hypothetical protein BGY98DRAFT_924325, partial [Russula aff. rugulosa BPL654]